VTAFIVGGLSFYYMINLIDVQKQEHTVKGNSNSCFANTVLKIKAMDFRKIVFVAQIILVT